MIFHKQIVRTSAILFFIFPAALLAANAKVMFHPFDSTMSAIGESISAATENIDIAMYNMDVSDNSPVMNALRSASVQSKLQSGDLQIRIVFEGYGTEEDNRARSRKLEETGADVRWLKSGKKVHHKFAVLDTATPQSMVISGSANWSLSSQNNYDENIMFWPNEPYMAKSFQDEFNLLWSLSDEFENTTYPEAYAAEALGELETPSDLSAIFNTGNYKIRNGSFVRSEDLFGWSLTQTIVDSIDRAQDKISIATTRIVLRPVYNALLRAAERGVKINILVNQDQYLPLNQRANKVPEVCEVEYADDCSKAQMFSWFLDNEDFSGKENVTLRIKFFSLNLRATLAKQMHSKYMVVDDQEVVSGSFNWSHSSEWSHIENLIRFNSAEQPSMVNQFAANHETIYSQGRDDYAPYLDRIETALKTGVKTDCAFKPMALTFSEIDWLLDSGKRHGKTFKDACK